MTKKAQPKQTADELQRQSRKEILVARKHERQLHNIRIAIGVILGLIAVVIGVAVVNEVFVAPNRAVATIGDKQIALRDWQNRVKYDRAQRVIFLENQLEAFGGDVGIVQQFGGQVINELYGEPEGLGQNALDNMAEELVICDALEQRGIAITDADVETAIGESFGYYGGLSPTAQPEPTQTVQPTPSITPIAAPGTENDPTATPEPTAVPGPTSTPFPTPTPISEAFFQEELGGLVAQFDDLGVSEETYRNVVRSQLCRERLADTLATEQMLPAVAPQASLFLITADTEEEANAVLADVQAGDYLTAWNTIRSRPAETGEEAETDTKFAYELLWRTQDSLAASVGPDVAAAAFDLAVNEPSQIIAVNNGDGTSTYYVIMVSGREVRPLSESEFETNKQSALQLFVDGQLTSQLVTSEFWRSRVPTSPVLDPKFLAAPTPAPTVPAPVEVAPTAAP